MESYRRRAIDGSSAIRGEFDFVGKRRIEMKRMKKVLFLSFFVVYPVAAASTPGACKMHVSADLNLNFQVPQTSTSERSRAKEE
jgi:hypothetical protein